MRNILFSWCIVSASYIAVHFNAFGASCPASVRYAQINYNHQLLNQVITTGTWSQASGLSGGVGLSISASGVTNAGNNVLRRTIDLVYTTSECDCLSETAESQVAVTVSGTCSNGVLNMNIKEVYPKSSALVTCTGGDSCPIYTQQYPGTTSNYTLKMNYIDGTRIIQPYTCTNCSGIYSWMLQFLSKPPPADDLQPVPLVPMLHLLLRSVNK